MTGKKFLACYFLLNNSHRIFFLLFQKVNLILMKLNISCNFCKKLLVTLPILFPNPNLRAICLGRTCLDLLVFLSKTVRFMVEVFLANSLESEHFFRVDNDYGTIAACSKQPYLLAIMQRWIFTVKHLGYVLRQIYTKFLLND